VKRNAFSSTQFSSKFLFLISFTYGIFKEFVVELGRKEVVVACYDPVAAFSWRK
jgi:hypothetical protein